MAEEATEKIQNLDLSKINDELRRSDLKEDKNGYHSRRCNLYV
jgi:hypothetical protein